MVLWRKNGVLSAFEDRCPHRHAQLSKGQVVGDRLQCRYHGIEFEKSGRAAMVPETGRGTNALCARTYVVDERQGWIRVKRDSGREAIGERGDFEIADVSEEAAAVEFTTLVRRRWKTHLTRAVESQLDYAHLATLHPILGQFAPESSVHPTIESSEDRMHWYFTDPRYYAEFQYPNLWTLVMPGNLVLSIAFAPVDDSTTDLIAQSGSNTLGNNLIVNLLSESWISQVLSEDQELVETQRPLDSRQDDSEKHFLSDSIIDWYRRRIARE
jgi:phenylpropionate dioxygenase-like ring-hydroxylating dioxygenase large terminal subunit